MLLENLEKIFKKNKIFLITIVLVLIIGNILYFYFVIKSPVKAPGKIFFECENIPELSDNALRLAKEVIDGDTFLIEGGYSVRVLGIDADERGESCYEEAKERLEELILEKEVRLEIDIDDLDKYCRYLRYVFVPVFPENLTDKDEKNISLELVKEGLAVSLFFPQNIKYREDIIQAEKQAKENRIGCKWSFFADLDIIDACEAGGYYNKEAIIQGKIVDAYRSEINTVFLNFGDAYPNQCFAAVIFDSDQYKFAPNPENYYLDKFVRIQGIIEQYQNKPQIILKTPRNILIFNF